MTDLSQLKFFLTKTHPCSYLPGQEATTLFLDPQTTPTPHLHTELSQRGFRRSGDYLYTPHCATCHACLPTRVEVACFKPDRRFRRISALNRDLHVRVEPPTSPVPPHIYDLYASYIEQRHKDGDMFPPSQDQFDQFLPSHWANTRFVCFYATKDETEHLLAVAVTDYLEDGLSAVYCFFDPSEAQRSLGTFAILWQINECRRLGLPFLYLGYLVRESRKMAYKEDFAPLQILTNEGWKQLTRVTQGSVAARREEIHPGKPIQ